MADSSRQEPFYTTGDDGPRRTYYPKTLLTESERPFFSELQKALPEYGVFPQVCMGALIDPPRHLRGEWRKRARYAYQSKIVDFVVWDAALSKVVCLVELDDPTHDKRKEEDAQRDAITAEAGYPTARFDVRKLPDQATLRQQVLSAKVPVKPAQRAEVLPFEKTKPRSTAQHSSRNNHARGASVGGVLLRLICLGAFAIFGLKVVLPWFGGWVTQQIKAPLVHSASPTKAAVTSVSPPHQPTSVQDAHITRQPCMVYENRDAIAVGLMRGCQYREVATFVPAMSAQQLRGWYEYDVSRLNGAAGCAPYAQWAREIIDDQRTSKLDVYKSLEKLFNDAIAKGCMRAPG